MQAPFIKTGLPGFNIKNSVEQGTKFNHATLNFYTLSYFTERQRDRDRERRREIKRDEEKYTETERNKHKTY